MIRVLALLLIAVLALPEAALASRLGSRQRHSHHRTVFVGSAFYFGAPWYPWYGYPYYQATSTPPPIYVEKFDGEPNANSGEIYCPSLGEYYPDVQQCTNGWQRIIRPEGS